MALGAFVEPLAGIGGHGFGLLMPAFGACDCGLRDDAAHDADALELRRRQRAQQIDDCRDRSHEDQRCDDRERPLCAPRVVLRAHVDPLSLSRSSFESCRSIRHVPAVFKGAFRNGDERLTNLARA